MPSHPPARRPRFRGRRLASLITTFGFLVLLASGVLLFAAPKGRVARDTDWAFLNLDRHDWIALHLTSSVLFLLAAALHIFFNWKALLNYMRSKVRAHSAVSLELAVALLLTAGVVWGTLAGVTPFRQLVDWRSDLKHGDASGGGHGAGKGSGCSDDEGCSEKQDGDHERGQGRGGGSGQGAGRGAGRGGEQGAGRGAGGGRGLGRKSLAQVCTEEGVAVADALERLRAAGVEATAEDGMRAIAQRLGQSPHKILEIVTAR